ncbi:MAG: hypothetical protein U1C33_01395, partial [Candidatus Cloacimonadaceae bacterium]|nr:hypothetical protein [Candidatus Cloacimonadaceae bacterium]
GALTADGRFLVYRPEVGGSTGIGSYYRDNLSMIWRLLEHGYGLKIGKTGSLIYYCDSSSKKAIKHDLDSGEKTTLFDKNIVPGRKLWSFNHITPFWDGNGTWALVYLEKSRSRD